MSSRMYGTGYQAAANRGFTLIEVMIVVAIIAIIAAFAYPSYRDQVVRSKRTDAKVTLSSIAQTLERCRTENNAYNAAGCVSFPVTSAEGHYEITVSNFSANSYLLTATPQGGQASDTSCTTLTLSQTGARGATGGDTSGCW